MHDIAKLVGLESRYAMGTRGQGEVAAELVEQMCTQAAAGSALVTRQVFYGVTRSLRLYNVLARIDGTAPRPLRRVVLIGAHYDTTNRYGDGAGPRADEEQGAPGVLTGRACTPSRCGPHQWLKHPPPPPHPRARRGRCGRQRLRRRCGVGVPAAASSGSGVRRMAARSHADFCILRRGGAGFDRLSSIPTQLCSGATQPASRL